MKKTFKYTLLAGAIILAAAACNPGNRADEAETSNDTAMADSQLMDTPMSTGAGSDTLRDSINEGVDGTGKPSTDPRTRKQH
jgi:hypothetical protein